MRDESVHLIASSIERARASDVFGRRDIERPISLARVVSLLTIFTVEVFVLVSRVPPEKWKAWAANASDDAVGLWTLIGLCCAGSLVAVFGFWGDRLVELLNRPSGRAGSSPWMWFAVHVLLVGAHLAATAVAFDGVPRIMMLAVWGGTAVAMFGSLALVLLPANVWLQLARGAGIPVLTSMFVGAAVYYVSAGGLKLWEPMTRSTIFVVDGLLRMFTSDVRGDPQSFSIGTSTFSVVIEAPCSGYEGIGLIWAFLATYLWFFRQSLRFPQALVLIPVATAVIWFTNAIRLVLLIAVGTLWSRETAMGGFHSSLGSVMFMSVGIALIVASHRLDFFRNNATPRSQGGSPAGPYLVPFMVLIGLSMIGRLLTADFDYLYPVRVVGVATALVWFARDYAQVERTWSWTAVAIGVVTYGLWIALEPMSSNAWVTGRRMPLALQNLPSHLQLTWIAVRIVGSVIAVPIAEELAFRGFLTRRIQAAEFETVPLGQFSWASFLISSILFGLLHGRWVAGTLAGMLYAIALYRRRRLSDAIIAHATTNALIAAHVLAGDGWPLWS